MLSKKLRVPAKAAQKVLWKGPCVDGVTQSMLNSFLVCRERFRVKTILGLAPLDEFNHRIEYGSMWHVCEEALAANKPWEEPLKEYAAKLCARYPLQQEQVVKWYNVCNVQFPEYVAFWANHRDTRQRKPLMQEVAFRVPYYLPVLDKTVILRGKWDSVALIGKNAIYLQENKTKGQIDEGQIKRQLSHDLQTMLYLIAIKEYAKAAIRGLRTTPIKGIRYNVIRRPLSGGKGNIRRHKATKTKPEETEKAYYARLRGIIAEEPATYFMRWQVEVSPQDIARFQERTLDPLLMQLCDWYDWVTSRVGQQKPFANPIHWQHPYGTYNVLNEGGSTDYDEYLASGSASGLQRAKTLFPELEE